MSRHVPSGHEIEMHSGGYVDLARPQPGQILLEDIAFSLSNIARYGGHVRFYSVAQHAWLVVSRLAYLGAPADVQLAGLHHDDPEAYIGDVPKPLKPLLPTLGKLNYNFEQAIKKALGLDWLRFDHPSVKAADTWALSYEAYWLMASRGLEWPSAGLYTPGDDGDPGRLAQWTPQAAEAVYLEAHATLTGKVAA